VPSPTPEGPTKALLRGLTSVSTFLKPGGRFSRLLQVAVKIEKRDSDESEEVAVRRRLRGKSAGGREAPRGLCGACGASSTGVLLKDPGVLLKEPGILLKDPGVL